MEQNLTKNGLNPDIKRKALGISLALIIISALCIVYIIYSRQPKDMPDYTIADIYLDGTLVRTIDLSRASFERFTIESADAGYNEIEVTADGAIGVIAASCPDKLCVHQGFVHGGSIPIVCLPNKLVIIIHSDNTVEDELDAVTHD